jgi:ATP-dependent HslUV protease ATP-binding subunit HslU
MARIAVELNEEDNVGARRLRTVLDAVLEDINYEAPDFEHKNSTVVITGDYVIEKCEHLYQNRDFRKWTI